MIAKLDTEGDIIIGIDRAEGDKVKVTIKTHNNEKNSQLQSNLKKLVPSDAEVDGSDISFEIEPDKDTGLYLIKLGAEQVVALNTETLLPEDDSTYEKGVIMPTRVMYATTKTMLAQKTDFNPKVEGAVLSQSAAERQESPENAFGRTDLHNHLAGMLRPSTLIALGIRHGVDYDLFLIEKFGIELSDDLKRDILSQISEKQGKNNKVGELVSPELAEKIKNGSASKKEIDSAYEEILKQAHEGKIDKDFLHDEIGVPLNEIITNPENLRKISLSMRIPIEGQAVFSNLEEVYDARDPFTKGNGRKPSLGGNEDKVHLTGEYYLDMPGDKEDDKAANKRKREKLTKDREEFGVPSGKEIEAITSQIRRDQADKKNEEFEGLSYEAIEVLQELERIKAVHKDIRGKGHKSMAKRFRTGLQEDMHLMIGEDAKEGGVEHIETSQATLAKHAGKSGPFIEAMTGKVKVDGKEMSVLEYIKQERQGPTIKYLAAIRRNFDFQEDFDKAVQCVIDSAGLDCCTGVDFMGEELNETAHFSETITNLARFTIDHNPNFVIRVHAGENNANVKNIEQVIDAVDKAFIKSYMEKTKKSEEDVKKEICEDDGKLNFTKLRNRMEELKKENLDLDLRYPQIRIGHGLYGPIQDEKVMQRMAERGVIVEFNVSSNVRLNNLAPQQVLDTFKELIEAYTRTGDGEKDKIGVVFGTDGYGIYGTTTRDEIEYIAQLFPLDKDQVGRIVEAESRAIKQAEERKPVKLTKSEKEKYIKTMTTGELDLKDAFGDEKIEKKVEEKIVDGKDVLDGKIPIVIAGGSFSTHKHIEDYEADEQDNGKSERISKRRKARLSEVREEREATISKLSEKDKAVIDALVENADPQKACFVIGHTGNAQEGYLLKKLKELKEKGTEFRVVAVMPKNIKRSENSEKRMVLPYQNETEERDIIQAFDLASDEMISAITCDGASKEGISTYKAFDTSILGKKGCRVVAFDGDAPLGNMIREGIDRGATIYLKGMDKENLLDEDDIKSMMATTVNEFKGSYKPIPLEKKVVEKYDDSWTNPLWTEVAEKYDDSWINSLLTENEIKRFSPELAPILYSDYSIDLDSEVAQTVRRSIGTKQNSSSKKGRLKMMDYNSKKYKSSDHEKPSEDVIRGTKTTRREVDEVAGRIVQEILGKDSSKGMEDSSMEL